MARTAVNPASGLDAVTSAVPAATALDARLVDLCQRHHRDVYRYVLASTRSHDEADDVTAETFARAYERWSSGAPPAGRVLPWLLLTARRISTDRWRRLRRLSRIVAVTCSRHDDGAEQGPAEFWLWCAAPSDALPARQREVLPLRYQRERSEEIWDPATRELGGGMGIGGDLAAQRWVASSRSAFARWAALPWPPHRTPAEHSGPLRRT